MEQAEVDDFLAHYGVAGMKWGKHNASSTPMSNEDKKVRLHELQRKINKKSGQYISGVSLRGGQKQKMYEKAVKKDPDFQYKNLNPEQKKAWEKKAARVMTAKIALSGVMETGVIAGGGLLAVNKMLKNPSTRIGSQVAVGLLAGKVASTRLKQVIDINNSLKVDAWKEEAVKLRKEVGWTADDY